MEPVESKITSKGQVSIPAAVRQRLDLGPGTRIEWVYKNGEIVVRRVSRFTSEDIHQAVFEEKAAAVSVEAMDDGIRARMKKKHAGH